MKLLAVLALVILAGIYYYVALPALNIHSTEFWIFLIGDSSCMKITWPSLSL